MKLLISFGVLLALAVGLRLAIPSMSANPVATGVTDSARGKALGDCPESPNCAGSESTRDQQRTGRWRISGPADQAMQTLAQRIAAQPGAEIVEQTDRYLHATFKTRVMGYIDDVEFYISDDEQSLQVRSASRLGYSDLGANAKRLDYLRSVIEAEL